jgi:hypothetical protein
MQSSLSANTKAGAYKTLVKPELTYRQAYLVPRKDAAFYRESYTDYADQIYLSLKLIKTYKLVNEIVIQPAVRTVRNKPKEIETVIDQAYARAVEGAWHFTAGKINESYGSGFFVSPSDLLNEDRDLYDPLYQQEGKALTRIGWKTGLWNIALGYIPKQHKSAEDGRSWVLIEGDVAETDLMLQYTYSAKSLSTAGVAASRFFGEHFELHVDSRYQQRQRNTEEQPERVVFDCNAVDSIDETARTIPGKELYCLNPTVDDKAASFYSVVGSRLVFTPKRTLILEGIQNQSGLARDEAEMYFNYVAIDRDVRNTETDPPTRILGRQYGFFAYQDEDSIADTMFNLSLLYNLNDQSFFANTELKYTINPMMNVSLVHMLLDGSEGSEYGETPYSQSTYVFVRANF